tara:strand:- start:9 stop:407 length:399 start_codon:yes stop_codon:yes gene_type:complete
MARVGIPGRTAGNQSTELSSLNEISRKLNELQVITAAVTGGAMGDATLAEQQAQTALLTTVDTNTTLSNLEKLKKADDLKLTFTYLDPGTDDERVSTIVYSSILDVVTPNVTKTFLYVGGPGTYRVDTITLS